MLTKKVEGFVYLIGERGNQNNYKIGFTRDKNIEHRLKKLQTGNSNELFIKYKFFSSQVTKLEKMLHFHYSSKHAINEWFEMTDEEVFDFLNVCAKCQQIIDSLSENPFF